MKYFGVYKAFVVSKRAKRNPRFNPISDLDIPPRVARGIKSAGGYKKVVSSIPTDDELARAARKHLALSDPTRIRILFALSKSELCPCVLKRITRISDSKLSYHLARLEDTGLVRFRRRENWRVYAITEEGEEILGR